MRWNGRYPQMSWRVFFLRLGAAYFDYVPDIDVDLNLRSVNCGMTFIHLQLTSLDRVQRSSVAI